MKKFLKQSCPIKTEGGYWALVLAVAGMTVVHAWWATLLYVVVAAFAVVAIDVWLLASRTAAEQGDVMVQSGRTWARVRSKLRNKSVKEELESRK